ncbi:protein phosphatase regulator [Leucoagaricus gongylophorus]
MPRRLGRIGDWSNDNDHDEESGDENDKRESWFAGGERSGISIQNPDRQRDGESQTRGGYLVRELLRRAAEGGAVAPEPRSMGGFRVFSGGGHTLGSDEMDSTFIPDPDGQVEEDEVVTRTITLWKDGFQIEDGDLMRYDDPNNVQILESINAGAAPIHLLNVRPGQPVELRINPRQQELYDPPTGVRMFGGSGQRLGAPVPELVSSSSPSSMVGSFPVPAATITPPPTSSQGAGILNRLAVDLSQPTTSIQVRLADGTRIVCRMNLTHTIGDIRSFVNASRLENASRPYTIGTTFPNRVLEDNTETIENAGLANSVVVQRWT